MTKISVPLFAALVGGCVGTAHAALFSFASDSNQTDFTFRGLGTSVRDAQDPSDPVQLQVDDDNGPMLPMLFEVEFDAQFTITHMGSTQIAPGIFAHAYALDGTFSFSDSRGALLTASITDGAISR